MADGMSMMERLEKTGSMLPKGVAYAVSYGLNGLRMVTYAELKQKRIERQRQHQDWVRPPILPKRRAGYVWTFFVPGPFYGGWWAYLRTLEGDEKLEVDRFGRGWKEPALKQAMELFPCGLLPIPENFTLWAEAFAHEHRRPGRFRRQGLAKVWLKRDGRSGWLVEKYDNVS